MCEDNKLKIFSAIELDIIRLLGVKLTQIEIAEELELSEEELEIYFLGIKQKLNSIQKTERLAVLKKLFR